MSAEQIQRRIQTGEWVIVLPRVYASAGVPLTWSSWVMAGCLRAAPGAAAAASTAARIWGLLEEGNASGFRSNSADRPIEIATTRNIRIDRDSAAHRHIGMWRSPSFRYHRVGRLPAHQISNVDGISVTSVERTLLDVAGSRAPVIFNQALDCALRTGSTSLARLEDFLQGEQRSGVDGVLLVRAALKVRRSETGLSRSVLEREFVSLLMENGLPLPELNQEIRGPDGFCALVDMLYREQKLIIEIQSYAHHSSLEAFNRDAARLATLTALGYRAIEVTAHQIRKEQGRTMQLIADLLRPLQPRGEGGLAH